MPLYPYECKACGHTFEKFQQDAREYRKCPECGRLKLKRLFGRVHFHDRLSPMHPRKGRGNNGRGRWK